MDLEQQYLQQEWSLALGRVTKTRTAGKNVYSHRLPKNFQRGPADAGSRSMSGIIPFGMR